MASSIAYPGTVTSPVWVSKSIKDFGVGEPLSVPSEPPPKPNIQESRPPQLNSDMSQPQLSEPVKVMMRKGPPREVPRCVPSINLNEKEPTPLPKREVRRIRPLTVASDQQMSYTLHQRRFEPNRRLRASVVYENNDKLMKTPSVLLSEDSIGVEKKYPASSNNTVTYRSIRSNAAARVTRRRLRLSDVFDDFNRKEEEKHPTLAPKVLNLKPDRPVSMVLNSTKSAPLVQINEFNLEDEENTDTGIINRRTEAQSKRRSLINFGSLSSNPKNSKPAGSLMALFFGNKKKLEKSETVKSLCLNDKRVNNSEDVINLNLFKIKYSFLCN